ncbi:MAG: class I SAM-dependent methyltransferase, partial [Alphaproteobacteria bacterium]|nr:class I SAM-dependent methyltransferase [Alphaproteobacteria bacterium]
MEKYSVSRETFEMLKTYQSLLSEWQKRFNLVSNSSLSNAWERHFIDSVQLWKHIPSDAKNLLDFGSGA